MDQTPVTLPTVREVLRSFQENKRLVQLVQTMAQEMERLNEDNRQLRAAVGLYREVARRRDSQGNSSQSQGRPAPPIEMPRIAAQPIPVRQPLPRRENLGKRAMRATAQGSAD